MSALRGIFLWMILEVFVVWAQETSQPITPTYPPSPVFNNVVNESLVVFVGEDVVVEEDVRVTINCGQLIDATIDNGISNAKITWYKDGVSLTTGNEINVEISADGRYCIITDTLVPVGNQLGTEGNYTCEVCNTPTNCTVMTTCLAVCGTPHIMSPIGTPSVTPFFISLTCGQDLAVPLSSATILIKCSPFNGALSYTFEVFKDGILVNNQFSLTINDDVNYVNYYGTYTFILSTEKCGHASAVSRILYEARNISFALSALDPQQVGQMLIIDCDNVNVPTTENFIVGEALILRCMVDTTSFTDSFFNFTFIWSSNNTVLRIVDKPGQNQDHYVISQLNTSNDGQEYMCEIIIRSIVTERINGTIELPLTVPPFSVTVTLADSLQGAMVGDTLDIQCTAEVAFNGVESNSVVFVWLGPEGIPIRNSSRVTISPTNSFPNTFNSTLHFSYLMEGDEDGYTCNVMILRDNQSDSIELGTLNIPTPNVSVTTYNDTEVGQPLILECNVIAVRGINSQVIIVWSNINSNEELRKVNNVNVSLTTFDSVVYKDYLNISQLTTDNNDVMYECEVTINDVKATDKFTFGISISNNNSDESSPTWTITGICGGVLLLIVIIALLLCMFMLRKRTQNIQTLNMKRAELNLYPLNGPRYAEQIRNIPGISGKISVDEWKSQLAEHLIDYDSLDIKETIAQGQFGVVYKAYYTSEEHRIIEVAIKLLKAFSSSTANDFIKECNIAKKFDHPNVLSLIGICIIPEDSVPLMVMPYMHHGDVKSFIKSKRNNDIKADKFPLGLDETILTKMCLDIAKGMEYLAKRHYVHRDLAARNCMLDDSMTTKVADFGLSRDIYVTDYYTMSHSTPLPVKWLAPEALFDRIFSERTDVWAFGVTYWEVFSLGLQPYPLIGPSELGDYIKSGKVLDKPQLSSDEMYEIMKSCWKFEPIDRPDFSELVEMINGLKDVPQNKPMIKKQSAAYLPVYS